MEHMDDDHKNENDTEHDDIKPMNHLGISRSDTIDVVPSLVMLNSSNFPSPKSTPKKTRFNFHQTQKSNQFESKTRLDLSHLLSKSKLSHQTQSISSKLSLMNQRKLKGLKSKNKYKLRYKGTNRNLNVKLLGINYDSKFGLDEEEDDIAKLDFEFARSLLTLDELEQVLIESPTVVHVSTHGSHHYKAVNSANEFQISFEETHTLRALIDNDPNYSAYYAVVALLFEIEINHFVQYGFDHISKSKSLRTYIWCNEEKFALLMNKKIYALFTSILNRFGIYSRDNNTAQCIEIYWGKHRFDTVSNTPVFVSPPHPPMDSFQLKTLYSHDEDVQEILKDINDDYNKSMAVNQSIAKSLKKHQKFSWEILSILLHRKLMDAGAEPIDIDDTKWMKQKDIDAYLKPKKEEGLFNIKEEKEYKEDTVFLGYDNEEQDDMKGLTSADVAEFFGDDDGDDDMKGVTAEDMAAFFGSETDEDDDNKSSSSFCFDDDEDHRTTKIKFGNTMDLTREIKIIPRNIDRGDVKSPAEMQDLIEKVSLFRDRLVKSIKKIPDIQIQLLAKSRTASNIHIIQFSNKWALTDAKKKIEKIREHPKYNHEYDILFRHISKADESTKIQCGFIKKMQEKVYRIDIKNKTDPISLMLRKHLRSKKQCRIKLLVLNGCHSFILGKIFSEFVENVICIHPFVKIWDSTATTFTRYFYSSLQEYTNPSTPFRQSVLKSYNAAKTYVAKQCSNDNACRSHSHSHSNEHINVQRMKWGQKRFNQLHFDEDWNELQNRINDPQQFKQYRMEMQKSGVLFNEPLEDLYDDKTLILSNIKKNTMDGLRKYLEESIIIDNIINDDLDFVEKAIYRKNKHYLEFSVGYFKFKSVNHRRMAIELLNQKIYDEELEFSDHILFGGAHIDDVKYDIDDYVDSLGWNHRIVPRCCCSPHHPHLAQDKLILLQDGFIINRQLIPNISQIKTGLKKLREHRDIRQQRKLAKQLPQPAENGADSSILSSCSDDINLKNIKSMNDFGNNDCNTKRNTFKNDDYFGSEKTKQKRTSNKKRKSGNRNTFGTETVQIHIKKNSFVFDDDKPIQNNTKNKPSKRTSNNLEIDSFPKKRKSNDFSNMF